MKLSAIFVSVNIVAAVPVAAQAAEEAVSDKAEWLKQNLAAMGNSTSKGKVKISISDPGVAPRAKDSKLRPFVANRKLPSKRDIEMQLSAQQARLDERTLATQAMVAQSNPLSGQIATYSIQAEPSPYAQIPASISAQNERPTRRGRSAAQRAIPGQVPALPGQVAALPAPGAALPRIPEPPGFQNDRVAEMRSMPRQQASFEQSLAPGEHMVRQSGAILVQAPVLTPDQQQMYDELLQLNFKSNSEQFVDLPGSPAARAQQSAMATPMSMPMMSAPMSAAMPSHFSAPAAMQGRKDPGPPPFPLNMLPPDALKQLVGRGRPHIDAPPAYFGSWHKPVSVSHLPEAGFHSNIPRRITGRYFGHYAPVAGQGSPRFAQAKRRRADMSSSQNVAFHQPEVAMYPAYGH